MELKITKERVLAAAAKHQDSRDILKDLFPEVFEEDMFETKAKESLAGWLVSGCDSLLWQSIPGHSSSDKAAIVYAKLKSEYIK